MKKTISLILTAVMILLCFSGCESVDFDSIVNAVFYKDKLPKKMPKDFSFSVHWSGRSYDSQTGTLSNYVDSTGTKHKTEYVMPEEKLKTVYSLIYDLDVLSYSDRLTPDDYLSASCVGSYFSLTVNANGISKTIDAPDAVGWWAGRTFEASKFFETVKAIGDILEATEEYQALPPRPWG